MATSIDLGAGITLTQETLEETVRNALTYVQLMLPYLPEEIQADILGRQPTLRRSIALMSSIKVSLLQRYVDGFTLYRSDC